MSTKYRITGIVEDVSEDEEGNQFTKEEMVAQIRKSLIDEYIDITGLELEEVA